MKLKISERLTQPEVGHYIDWLGSVGYRNVNCSMTYDGHSENAEAVRQFIWNHYAAFDNRTLAVAVKDIDYYLTSSLFQAANAEEWRKLQAAFKSEIDNREAQEGACP